MTDLLEKAIAELSKLPVSQQDMVASWILEKLSAAELQTEAEWEAEVLTAALGGIIGADGSIDFDALDAQSKIVTLSELGMLDDQDIAL